RWDPQRAPPAAAGSRGEGPARSLLVPRGAGPQPRRPAQRRRAGAPRPREVHRSGLRPPRPRRADEPPRYREPGDRGGRPADVSGNAARREPQPQLPERGGQQDRGHRAPSPRRVPGDVQGLVGRGEDGGVHGGEAEASVPRPAHGEGLGDRDGVSQRGRDRAPGGGDPGVPAPAAVGRGERPRGADRDVSPAGSTQPNFTPGAPRPRCGSTRVYTALPSREPDEWKEPRRHLFRGNPNRML